jgi:hypothetical protein
MLNIITSFYIPKKDAARELELKKTLHNNLNNNFVKKIHLFLDKDEDEKYINSLSSEKINIVRIGQQPLYSELFNYANKLPNELCMISNGDIWIGEIREINPLLSLLQSNTIFALTRHEMNGEPYLINLSIDSHDAFVFKSPINPLIENMVKFKQNIWGAENNVIDAMVYLRYKIINPCLQFKIIHEHDMKRPNRIEEGRPRMPHKRNSIKACVVEVQNKNISIKKYIQPRFRMFN